MANTRRTVRAANQQSTPHDGVITPSSHDANMPPEGSNAQLQGSDLPPAGDNPTQGTTVPPIQETESSLPLTGIPTGTPTAPLTSIQAAIATLPQFSNRDIAATTEQTLQGHGVNFPPPRINDPPLLPPPPPRRASNDIPPYGQGPEVGFRDYSGPYTTDMGESTDEDDHPRRDRRPLERTALESQRPPRPPISDLQRQQVIEDEILAHRAQIKELTKNLALTKARSRPERPKRNQVMDLDGTPREGVGHLSPRDDPIVLLPLGDPDDPTPPFTEGIMRANISRRFKMSVIKTYEGIGDPANHIRTFSNALLLQPVSDALKCRAFPQTLGGQAQRWYIRLPPNSIASFKELSRAFIGQFISGKTHKKSSASLMSIEQGKNESLRTYIDRFTKEALKVPDLDEKVAMIALQQGTTDVYFKMSLAKHAPQDMNQLQERAGKYIKAEESMRKSHPQPDNDKKRKKDSSYNARDKFQRAEKSEESTPRKLGAKFAEYAKLNAPRSQILMDIEKDKDLKWPKPLKSDPGKRNQNLFCRYHKEVGHNTDDCIQLKNEN